MKFSAVLSILLVTVASTASALANDVDGAAQVARDVEVAVRAADPNPSENMTPRYTTRDGKVISDREWQAAARAGRLSRRGIIDDIFHHDSAKQGDCPNIKCTDNTACTQIGCGNCLLTSKGVGVTGVCLEKS